MHDLKGRVTVALITAASVVAIFGFTAYRGLVTVDWSDRAGLDARELRHDLWAFRLGLVHRQSAVRRFLVTGTPDDLAEAEAATVRIDRAFRALGRLHEIPEARAALTELPALMDRLERAMEEQAEARRVVGGDAARVVVLTGRGLRASGDLLEKIDAVEATVEDALASRSAEARDASRQTIHRIAIGAGATLIVLGVVLLRLGRQIGLYVERRRAEAELEAANVRLVAVLEAATQVSMIATDARGTITVFNSGAERLLGYSREEMIGLRTPEHFHDPAEVEAHAALLSAEYGKEIRGFDAFVERARRGTHEVREWGYLRKDGRRLTVLLAVTVLHSADGQITGFLGVAVDVTERHRVETELRNARMELERRVRERTAELEAANEALVAEIGERRRVMEALHASERQLRFLADAMPQMVWTARPDGYLDYYNRRWYEFTGFEEGVGGDPSWSPILHPDDLRRCIDTWYAAVHRGSPYEIEYRFFDRESGTYRWHLGLALPRIDENGDVVQWVGTCTDIDDRKRAEAELHRIREELEIRVLERTEALESANASLRDEIAERRRAVEEACRAREAALAASHAKGQFLANMSHEIRTPMNGIIGMTELAMDTDLTPRQREYLRLVRSSSESLLTIINDILDFSKVEAGKIELESSPFSLRDLLEDTMATLAFRAHGKGLELATRIDPLVPESMLGDVHRLRQVIVNLVGNAIKFTESGEVVLAVEAVAIDDRGASLRFSVRDTGIGIPESKLEQIFAPFEQADSSTTRRFGGTGLGLAIAARLVDLMGGRIVAESAVGVGSTFRFEIGLPLGPDPLQWERAGPSALRGLRVLIVDDNVCNCRILTELLKDWGLSPSAATGGPEAMAALRRAMALGEPFRAVLTDLMMPVMDGLELAGAIAADPELSGVPVLLLTSAGRREDTSQLKNLGIVACLPKPIRRRELNEALLATFGRVDSSSTEPIEAPDADEDATAPPGDGPRRRLRVLVVDDHDVNRRLAVHLLENMGHVADVAVDGKCAIEAMEASAFDLVLMDLQMPVIDGFEAIRAIRGREQSSGTVRRRVVALTAHAMAGDRERCLAGGFDDYLAKPIRRRELRRVLDGTEVASEEPATEAPSAGPLHELELVADGDPAFLRELAESFLESAPRCLEDIEAAMATGDAERIARACHGLKGISRTIGAAAIADPCQKAEESARRGDPDAAREAIAPIRPAWDRLRPALEEILACVVADVHGVAIGN